MKQIPNSNLYIEVVNIDAYNFIIINSHSYFNSPRVEHCIGGFDLPFKTKIEDWEMVGTVSKTEIDFDCEPYVEKQLDAANNNEVYYANYLKNKEDDFYFEMKKEDSLRSFLEANGFYWVNPLGKKPSKAQSLVGAWELLVADSIATTIWKLTLEQWKNVESKKIKPNEKLVILKQII